MKKVILILAIVCYFPTFAQQLTSNLAKCITEKRVVYFDTNSKDLTVDNIATLSEVVYKLRGVESYKINISAHADKRSASAYNKKLAAKRASNVMEYFLERNINANNIAIENFGENIPVDDGDTESSWSKNRRVEIVFTIPIKTEQKFTFGTDSDTLIRGMQGTLLYIDAYSLVHEDGTPPTGEIQLTLEEYYKKSDIILAGLSTYSGNKILETGGMLYLEAKANNKTLKLKKGKRIDIYFPFNQNVSDMMLFNGRFHKEKGIDWTVDNNSSLFDLSNYSDHPPYFDYTYSEPKLPRLMKSNVIEVAYKICRPFDYRKRIHRFHTRIRMQHYAEWKSGYARALSCHKENVKKWEELMAKKDEFYRTMKASPESAIQNVDAEVLMSHIRSTSALGWINCDRFSAYPPESLLTYKIKINENIPDDCKLQLVFKSVNSILSGCRKGDYYVFENVPLNEAVVVVGVKNNNNSPELVMKEVTIGREALQDLKFDKLTFSELNKKLEMLN